MLNSPDTVSCFKQLLQWWDFILSFCGATPCPLGAALSGFPGFGTSGGSIVQYGLIRHK
jgi:hypothetical protein